MFYLEREPSLAGEKNFEQILRKFDQFWAQKTELARGEFSDLPMEKKVEVANAAILVLTAGLDINSF